LTDEQTWDEKVDFHDDAKLHNVEQLCDLPGGIQDARVMARYAAHSLSKFQQETKTQ
jgi:hypothetical protein